jgi:hypothetical protein
VDGIIYIDFYKEKSYVIIIVFGMLLFQQKYRIALYLIFLLGGFGILFLTTIPSGYPLPYKESYANVWGVLGIVYLFINNEWGTRWVKYYALSVIFSIGAGNAQPSTQYYKDRVMGIKGFVAETQSKSVAKTYLLRQDMRYSTGWEQAYETLLYSALHPPCVSSMVVFSPPDSQLLQKKNILLGAE